MVGYRDALGWLLSLIALPAFALTLRAQTVTTSGPLTPGDRVSVYRRVGGFVWGDFVRFSRDTLILTHTEMRLDGTQTPLDTLRYELGALDSMSVRRHDERAGRRDAAGEGATLGAVIGAMYGVAIGVVVAAVSKKVDLREGSGKGALWGTGVGLLAGVSAGLFTDAPGGYGDSWETLTWTITPSAPPTDFGAGSTLQRR
jgi:hypothetical protein